MGRSIRKRSTCRRSLVSVITALCLWASCITSAATTQQQPIYVACAANFHQTLKKLIVSYRKNTHSQTPIFISSGSSGSLFQQIRMGSPHHIFLSADAYYPEQLDKEQLILTGSRKTYAIGELILWHPSLTLSSIEDLPSQTITLALANPKTAPYGSAAIEVLTHLKTLTTGSQNTSAVIPQWKLVTGNSIAQTHQFIHSGNAQAGFIGRSQVSKKTDHTIIVPNDWYTPLQQQMVLLKTSKNHTEALQFFEFLTSKAANEIVSVSGYGLPKTKAPSTVNHRYNSTQTPAPRKG